MIYGVKFVYVNLQTDGQAIWQKNKKLLYKITELEKSKNLCSTHAKWSRTVLECFKIILEFSRTMF